MKQGTSTTFTQLVAIAAAVWALLPITGFAEENETAAQSVTNQAIAKLAAWENKAAREILESHRASLGATPEFKTAWALLEIQDPGAQQNAKAQGEKSLGQLAQSGTPNGSAAYYQGETLYIQGKKNEAGAAWQKAANLAEQRVAADPTDATAQYYRGASLVRLKKFDQAREALSIAVRGGFDPAMVNYQIGLSHLFSGQWAPGKEAFDLGLEVNPQFAPMYFWRAMAWEKLGRKDNMLIDLDQYVKLAPNAPDAGKARTILKSAGR